MAAWPLPLFFFFKGQRSLGHKGFDVDYYFLDSNFMDAKAPEERVGP